MDGNVRETGARECAGGVFRLWCTRRLGWLAGGLLVCLSVTRPARAAETGEKPVSLWETSGSLRTWAGYRDNPQLSSVHPVSSAFVAGGGDVMVFRVPMDGLEVSCFGTIEHLGYVVDDLPPETTAVLDVRVRKKWAGGWLLGGGLEYFYLKQVFDASELEAVPIVIPTEGHAIAFRPVTGQEFGEKWRVELEPEVSRQWLAEPLDGFFDAGMKLQAIRRLGPKPGSEAAVSYRFRDRSFDSRLARDGFGRALDTTLTFDQHEWEASWRSVWDAQKTWRTTLRANYVTSSDNGGGYFDYDRLLMGAQVRYVRDALEIRADLKSRWYMYPVQRIAATEGQSRERWELAVQFRAEWNFRRGVKAFGFYEWERADENVDAADYQALSVGGGIEVEL